MPVECSELSQTIADIALNIGSDPSVRNIDDVVAVMKKDFPEFERSHIVDAIVEASTSGPRSQSAMSKKLEALKNEARRTSEPLIRKRLLGQIAEMNRQLATGDIVRPSRISTPLTKELERLQFERDQTRRTIDRKIASEKPLTLWGKVKAGVGEPINLARSVKTSIDFSAVGRQGGFIALGHPVRAAKSLGPMFRAFASEKYAWRVAKEIEARPNAPLYAKSKLYFAQQNGPLSAHEEGFISRIAGKIPGIKHSERAYNTFLNKLRADSFDAMSATLARNGEPTFAETKAIANYINVATGRAPLGSMEQAAGLLNQAFFSARYATSRFQLALGQPFYGGSAASRKLIAKEYARFLIGTGVVYALGLAAGGSIEADPRSSDFGKVRFGKTRIDPVTGLSQATVAMMRVGLGSTKSSTTNQITPLRGPGSRPNATPMVLFNFTRNKLAPVPAAAADYFFGEQYTGKPVPVKKALVKMFVPMSAADVEQGIEQEGVTKGTAVGLASVFGMGVQIYGKDERAESRP